MTRVEPRLLAILFTDVVGSTERASELGDRGWRDLLGEYHAVVRRELGRYGGREANTAGDGVLATFDRPARAIRAAWAIREAVRELGLEVRSGIHAGEVDGEGPAIGGITVHIGVRLAALAGPGEVLVSEAVRELVVGAGFRFEERGTHELRGVPGRWRVHALKSVPAGPLERRSPRIAVLTTRRLMLAALAAGVIAGLGVVYSANRDRAVESPAAEATAPEWAGSNRTTIRLTAAPGLEAEPSWSPDGRTLAYISDQSGNPEIWIRPVDGGEEWRLTEDPAEDGMPAWSRDGRRIAFVSSRGRGERLDRSVELGYLLGGALWVAPAVGGEADKVIEDGFHPSWSPDGRLAFDASLDGPRRIWTAAADGTDRVRVTTDASNVAAHTRPQWSPDGRWIVYERQEGSLGTASDIQIVSAEGGTSKWLTKDQARDFTPAWLNDRVVVFSSDRGGAINLWAIEIELPYGAPRGEPVQLTTGAGVDVDPAASPDGRRLAFASVRFLENLWMMKMDPADGPTGGPRPILDSSWSDVSPVLSPDGGTIAFASDRGGENDLWTVSVAGGTPQRLTREPGREQQPDWSPDGRAIAFFSDREGNNDIWVIPATGGTPIRLTSDPAEDINPFWSPDGSRIAFMSDRSGQSEVWVMRSDGSGPRRLTNIGATEHTARWSPDGRWILFGSEHGGDRDVWIVPSAGGEPRRLTSSPGQEAHGLWSSDGSRVLYLVDHRQLWSVPLAGGAPTLLFEPDRRLDYTHLSRDGRLLVFTFQRVDGDLWVMEGFEP